jgi:type IV pilus assembly protein PilF
VKRLIAVWIVAILVGCNSNPATDPTGQQPVAQQGAGNDATQRAKVHTKLGMAYASEGRLSVALDEARLAIALDSTYPLAYNLMGFVQMLLRDVRQAEEYFGQALRLAPGDPEINNNYGWFLCQTDHQQQSFAHFEAAARNPLYSTPTKPLTNAGICAIYIKDDNAAEAYFQRALKVDPANADARSLLAGVCYRLGRYGEARLNLNELHKLAEPSAESVWLGIRIERKLGGREEEARYASLLRRKFRDSEEYKKYVQGLDE